MTAKCDGCGTLMRAADEQVELRAEYRSVVGRRRLFAWRVRLLCRRCAMEDWLAHNKPQGAQGQGTLFG